MEQRAEIRRLGKSVGKMAGPVLIEQFFIVIMGAINTMLASNMGKEAISAIGMIDTISNIIISLFGALAIGGTVMVAQYTGRKDRDTANQTAAQALTSSLLVAGLVTGLLAALKAPLLDILYGNAEPAVLGYAREYLSIALWSYVPIAMVSIAFGVLRGAGDTRTPMIISILMNFFNVVFSSILIYGMKLDLGTLSFRLPAFGVRGAATGLTLARMAGMLLVLIPLIRGSKQIKLDDWRLFKVRWDLQRCIFRLGIPASAEQLMFQGGRLITQTFIVRLGTAAMAANTIANSIVSLILIPGNALAIAATALVGQQIGAGKPKEARKQLSFLIAAASVAMGLISILMFAFRDGFIRLYTPDVQIAGSVSLIIFSALLAQPLFWSTSFITPAGLRGAGDIRYTMLVSIVSMWIIRIFFGYIFAVVLPWGVLGVWIAMYADWVVRSAFFIRRMRRGEWLQRAVIRDAGAETGR